MKAFWTIGLLIISNIFMTFAWYGHLKMKQTFSWFEALPLIGVVAFAIAGAMVGVRKNFDLFGVLLLSVITSFGAVS